MGKDQMKESLREQAVRKKDGKGVRVRGTDEGGKGGGKRDKILSSSFSKCKLQTEKKYWS